MPTQTEEQRKRALADAGVSAASLPAPVAAPTPLPTASTPVDASVLGGTTPFTLPPAPTLASLDIGSLLTAYTAPTATERTQDELGAKVLAAGAKLDTRSGAQAKAEIDAGVPNFQKELNDINFEIRDLQAQSLSAFNTSEDRLAPTFAIRGEQAQIERQRSVKALGLSAVAQAIQGNISLAQSQADRAVEMEFAPVEAELNYLSRALQLNESKLSREDSKRAETLQILLQERQRELEEQKAERTYTSNLMLEAARNGAPSNIIEQIRTATPDQAVGIASSYFGAEFKQKAEQIAFENGIKTREMQMREAEFNLNRRKSVLELALAGDAGAVAELGYDPNNLPLTPDEIASFETQKSLMERDLNIANRALKNGPGIQSSSGLIQGGIAGAFFESPGGVLLSPIGAPLMAAKKQDFLADASYIVKNLTFKKIKELGEQGIKLTPISEKELKAMGDASDVLVSAARFDDAGNLTGFNMSEGRVREQLKLVADHYQKAKDDITAQMLLSNDDKKEIMSI